MLFVQHSNFAQNCTYTISGYIKEDATKKPMIGATIFLKEVSKGVVSDEQGFFKINSICKGNYHLVVSHIGCEDQEKSITIDGGHQSIEIEMQHFVNRLNGVHLRGKYKEVTTQIVQVVKQSSILKNANENLANQLENLTGVTTVKNGNSIAKPVVHGLYGSRVVILNNNIVQSGQQWGNDHAPEIDPLMAGSLQVIKGVGALEYQGSGLGSVINVIPKRIKNDPHMHGSALYLSETNGLGNNLNISLEQKNSFLGWRATGTLKKYGDQKAPNYFLTNTGSTEANLSLQIEKKLSKQWESKWYASTFNTILGVLRGSHVTLGTDTEDGELSDYATSVLYAEEPQFTKDKFSYNIEAPKQEVHHHLLKWENNLKVSDEENYTFTYAGQINNRKEYDVRRSGRSDTPALSLLQQTHFIEAKHQKEYKNNIGVKKGIQYTFTDNTNNPETDILPLIPDYLSHQVGGFVLFDKDVKDWKFELGARYNFTYQSVAYIERTNNREVENYSNYFHNYSISTGANYHTQKDFHWSFNLGLTSRNPNVNELYSYGLHQGVSGFEIGDPDLKQETGMKAILGFEGNVNLKWFFESLVYAHYIDNYIYLQSKNEFLTTIRGTFPLFEYEQTNANIIGLDFGTNYLFTDTFSVGAKYSFIRGNNLSESVPLVFMPVNNTLIQADYNGFKDGFLKNSSLGIEYKYVWRQNHLLDWQDILLAPEAYQLVNVNFNSEFLINNTKVNTYAKVNNLLNVTYRDYLNRLRYFSDDIGRSITLGFKVSF